MLLAHMYTYTHTHTHTQVPVVGWSPLKSLEQLAPLAVFLAIQLLEYCEIQRRCVCVCVCVSMATVCLQVCMCVWSRKQGLSMYDTFQLRVYVCVFVSNGNRVLMVCVCVCGAESRG